MKTLSYRKKCKNFAFTLAEVLITLGIVGVVAAMTIPSLISNYQKNVYATRLKKAYTEINNVLIKMSEDAGCPGNLACAINEPSSAQENYINVGDAFSSYFKINKNCGYQTSGCFSEDVSLYYDGRGTRSNYYTSTMYTFITSDGMAIKLWSARKCGAINNTPGYEFLRQWCGTLAVDVNGPNSKPNNFGRDIFRFEITNGKGPGLYPSLGSIEAGTYWKDGSGNPVHCYSGQPDGEYCTARIMEEGWEMKY